MALPADDHDGEDQATPRRADAQAMGDQDPAAIRGSLPPGSGTKPADARGDVDRLAPYAEDVAPLRMSDVEVAPADLPDDVRSPEV